MLMDKAVVSPRVLGAPVDTGVTYVAGKFEIQVPVHLDSSENVFAPPFLIPGGNWTVIFKVQDPGLVFVSVTFTNAPPALHKTGETPGPGTGTWQTTFDTSDLDGINMMDCNIVLKPKPGNESSDFASRGPFSGDPTIAVVPDPMG